MNKILEWFGGTVVNDILGGLDELFTSKEERLQAENVIKKILVLKELELIKMQTNIIITEATGNWLQRSWRPILMLSFGFIVMYVKFIGPVFQLHVPPLEDEFWNLLQLGIGGYVIGRTGEKMMESFANPNAKLRRERRMSRKKK
tara:strand:+ start:1946 stop:2380 length:435 start_codon:yes stop_codon:yes gene_type:complete